MGDLTYWTTVAETAGWFILWTLICAALVGVAERIGGALFRRRPSADAS